jgi:hypothetical protein
MILVSACKDRHLFQTSKKISKKNFRTPDMAQTKDFHIPAFFHHLNGQQDMNIHH